MMYKSCTSCKQVKALELFGVSKAGKMGRTERCKECRSNHFKSRYHNDSAFRTDHAARTSKWQSANKAQVAKVAADWQRANRDKCNVAGKKWSEANRDKCAEKSARRHAMKLAATPSLPDEDSELNDLALAEAYSLAKLRYLLTKVHWEVDHRVPLISDKVCGLHYYRNIQVITKKENRVKSNKQWEGMWQY